ncbi:MAG: restriction endonuclease subunit S [Candidatus Poribacteria bacterium]|nr:restriction endonuclease subunit S [Candidatus Poribacteria bacterium]
MDAGLKPYEQMKDSGVEWLGEVPEHWKVRRLKSVALQISDQTYGHQEHAPYVALEHVESGTGRVSPQVLETTDSQLKRFKSGDILFGKLRPYLAKVVRANFGGLCVSEFLVLRTTECISERYLEHLLRSKSAIDWINSSTFGARMPRADWQFVGNTNLPLPSPSEQTAIANFLNDAIGQIESYIRAKEKLITLLEEQKKVSIHDAVTGRIDVRTGKPYPAYNPTSVEWLREIPAHWNMVRNGQLFAQRNEVGFSELPILEVSLRSGVRVRDFENSNRKQILSDLSKYKRAVKGDIAYNMMRMWQGAVGVAPVDGLVSPAYIVARPLAGIEPRFFDHLFHINEYMIEVDKYSRGIVKDRNRLYWEDFKQMPTPCPPLDEQVVIADTIDRIGHSTSAEIGNSQKQIDLANEYRTRLIADVVTGKLDVRKATKAPSDEEMSPLHT